MTTKTLTLFALILALIIALPVHGQQSGNCIPDPTYRGEAPPPCFPCVTGNCHNRVDPSTPPSRRRVGPYPTLVPYFPMGGFMVQQADLQDIRTIAVITGPNAASSPRSNGTVLNVYVWRYRHNRWCRTQTLAAPVTEGAITLQPLDLSSYRVGDSVEFETWLADTLIVFKGDGTEMLRRFATSEPAPRSTWTGVYNDCTE